MSSATENDKREVDLNTLVALIVDQAATILSFGDPEGWETQCELAQDIVVRYITGEAKKLAKGDGR